MYKLDIAAATNGYKSCSLTLNALSDSCEGQKSDKNLPGMQTMLWKAEFLSEALG